MNDKDTFAVWIAAAMLRVNNEDFAAEALASLSGQARTGADLDKALSASSSGSRRPGDFGVEFLGALLPAVLVEFGRMLWDAYARDLAVEGGKTLATVTIEKIKELTRHTWSRSPGSLSLIEVEAQLRGAAQRAGFDSVQTEKLVASLHSPEMAHGVAAQ